MLKSLKRLGAISFAVALSNLDASTIPDHPAHRHSPSVHFWQDQDFPFPWFSRTTNNSSFVSAESSRTKFCKQKCTILKVESLFKLRHVLKLNIFQIANKWKTIGLHFLLTYPYFFCRLCNIIFVPVKGISWRFSSRCFAVGHSCTEAALCRKSSLHRTFGLRSCWGIQESFCFAFGYSYSCTCVTYVAGATQHIALPNMVHCICACAVEQSALTSCFNGVLFDCNQLQKRI